ncbi:hypothetical protein LFL96_36500 (plasmid) [Paraburkholderia sp. D15]|uniref:hypothetical protein n=1 Tax=Paraburkholderia sp. D15 TaxID=2880218 RepID=UPI00247840C0|nr:hypothetical protein [Paraburkholderia sp. D15]WGS54984.1 hypothetical protein LFL96_36500 [Paraburkholderia sp. D15]
MPYEDRSLDDVARAELLCYLVVTQLVARARVGEWLRTDHLVESTRIWLTDKKRHSDWNERVDLAQQSGDVAKLIVTLPSLQNERVLARLFLDGWRLNYGSPVVQGILDVCNGRLMRNRHEIARRNATGWPPQNRSGNREAMALELAVRATRRAQGKRNPEDVPVDSPEWNEILDDFLLDLYRAKGG